MWNWSYVYSDSWLVSDFPSCYVGALEFGFAPKPVANFAGAAYSGDKLPKLHVGSSYLIKHVSFASISPTNGVRLILSFGPWLFLT